MIIPKKSLGQNFLTDKNIINKIINITKIKNENIVEIGPGLGALTNEIISFNPKELILIEKDINLYNNLKITYNKHNNVKVINEDVMNFDFKTLSKYKIISNLPYNISTKFLIKVFPLNSNLKEIVCMIQKEVANKINYKNFKMNKYKFLCKYCGKYEIMFDVSNKVFYPKPKVKSNVIKFTHNSKDKDIKKLEFFINNFFINKRKKIKSNKIFIQNKNIKNYNDLRYEELKYEEVLDIYEGFNFSCS